MREDRNNDNFRHPMFGRLPTPPVLERLVLALCEAVECCEEWDGTHPVDCDCPWCVTVRGFHYPVEVMRDVLVSELEPTPAIWRRQGMEEYQGEADEQRTCAQQEAIFEAFCAGPESAI